MFKDRDGLTVNEKKLREQFGARSDLIPLLDVADEVIAWANLAPADTDERLKWCEVLREFFSAEELWVDTSTDGPGGGLWLTWNKLSLEGELKRLPSVARVVVRQVTDPRKRRLKMRDYLRAARSGDRGEFLAVMNRTYEEPRPREERPVEVRSFAAAPARELPKVGPTKGRRPSIARDLRALRRLFVRLKLHSLDVRMFSRWRRRNRFDRQTGLHYFRTFQAWEAEHWQVSMRTIRRAVARLRRAGLVWWIKAGSPRDRNPLLGLVKNTREWRRRWRDKRRHQESPRKVVPFKPRGRVSKR